MSELSETVFEEVSGFQPDPFGSGQEVAVFGRVVQPMVTFYRDRRLSEARSREAERPIYIMVDMVKVQHPGEPDFVAYEAIPYYQKKYARQWAAYKAGIQSQETAEGTPLSLLFVTRPDIVANFEHVGITTVEQLAAVADGTAEKIPGGIDGVRRARKYLDAASGAPGLAKMQAEIDALRAENKRLAETQAAAGKGRN